MTYEQFIRNGKRYVRVARVRDEIDVKHICKYSYAWTCDRCESTENVAENYIVFDEDAFGIYPITVLCEKCFVEVMDDGKERR